MVPGIRWDRGWVSIGTRSGGASDREGSRDSCLALGGGGMGNYSHFGILLLSRLWVEFCISLIGLVIARR